MGGSYQEFIIAINSWHVLLFIPYWNYEYTNNVSHSTVKALIKAPLKNNSDRQRHTLFGAKKMTSDP